MRFSRQPQGEPTMAWVSVFFKSPLGSMQTPEQSLPVLGLAQTIPWLPGTGLSYMRKHP